MRTLRKAVALAALLGSGCCAGGTSDDCSWVGGVIGGILGFALFFLVNYLTLRGRL